MKYATAQEIDYEIITTRERAYEVIASFTQDERIAVDLETTGLEPDRATCRITTLWNDKHAYVFDHSFCPTFKELASPLLQKLTMFCFHIMFEGKWFEHYAYDSVRTDKLIDIAFMRKAVQGGGGLSLALMAKWDLKVELDKGNQVSDWGRISLTKGQYDYAAYDGYVTWELVKLWSSKMTEGHWNGCMIMNNAWRANLEMQATGLYLDEALHLENITMWETRRATCEAYVRKFVGVDRIGNLGSNLQVAKFLKAELSEDTLKNWPVTTKTKAMQITKDILMLTAAGAPYPMNRWLVALAQVRYYNKYLSTYGRGMLALQKRDGKILSKFNMAQAITTRYSSCVAGGTMVTTDKGPVRADCIKVGDKVLTHTGRYQPVVRLFYKGLQEAVKYTFSGGATVTATPNHRILTLTGWEELQNVFKNDNEACSSRVNTSGTIRCKGQSPVGVIKIYDFEVRVDHSYVAQGLIHHNSKSNLQNIPRKVAVRRAFTVGPHGNRKMVLADYSGIEVRTAAAIAGDDVLMHDVIHGDTHSTGAALAMRIPVADFMRNLKSEDASIAGRYKAARQRAKVFTFRLLYGAGTGALGMSLSMNGDDTKEVVARWAEKYPKTYNYRYEMLAALKTGYLPVVDGKTIYVRKADRSLPVAANYPIQAAAASVLYAAVYKVQALLVERDVNAYMAAVVHDEIILYADNGHEQACLECLEEGMEWGWLKVFPNTSIENLLESAIGGSWAAKP